MKKVIIEERDFLRRKRIKSLKNKVKKSRKELIRNKMLLLFKLKKELREKYMKGGCKNNKTMTRQIYKSFERKYL